MKSKMTEDSASVTEKEQAGKNETGSELYSPGPNALDITPNKDGGVLKEIIKDGSGMSYPATGDKVSVHYTGMLLDGTVFDSSKERGEKFEFTLGKGQVIKGWDIGVSTMKQGEICKLICLPHYAYGEAGSPPKILPNATLVFEIELFEWKLEDLTSCKDNGVLKRVILEGEGFSTPNDDADVSVHLIGKYKDNVFEDRELRFPLGEGSDYGIVEGLEIALKSLKKGEKCEIFLKSKYAFDKDGKPEYNIPPDADIQYEVTLKSFEKAKESWEMGSEEKLEQSEIIKTKGTDYFKRGKYDLAAKLYQKIEKYLQYESGLEGEKEQQKKALLLAGYLNVAACYLKLENYQDAIKSCDKALELDPQNAKGHFRRGQALLTIKDYEGAKGDFQDVLKIDPNNKAAQNQVILCSSKIKQQLEKERKTYRNMFEKFAKQDAKHQESEPNDSNTSMWNTDEAERSSGEPMEADISSENSKNVDADSTSV